MAAAALPVRAAATAARAGRMARAAQRIARMRRGLTQWRRARQLARKQSLIAKQSVERERAKLAGIQSQRRAFKKGAVPGAKGEARAQLAGGVGSTAPIAAIMAAQGMSSAGTAAAGALEGLGEAAGEIFGRDGEAPTWYQPTEADRTRDLKIARLQARTQIRALEIQRKANREVAALNNPILAVGAAFAMGAFTLYTLQWMAQQKDQNGAYLPSALAAREAMVKVNAVTMPTVPAGSILPR